jgi:hypothetical protein
MMANNASEAMIGFSRNVSDQVTVVESWRLPSVKGSKDGKHTISIQDCVLFDEVYEKDHFPFANFKWCKRLNGYWAQGAAEQIQNIQLEINKILWIIQRSYHLAGSFKVLLENGSKIVKEHLNNDVGAIINYSGTQPTYITPPVIPVEYYGHLQTLKQSAYEQLGVSQLSASSKKPEGLDSGKALREFNDIESERFMAIGKAYEDFYLQLGKLAVDCAREIALDDDYEVGAVTDDTYVKINWREVDLDEDSCTMQIFPISSFSNDPAARLQEVQEYVQAGFISPRQARRLFDFPDLKQIEELANSKENYLHKILEQIVDDGIYTPPEPYDDLELALQLGLEYYSKGKLENLEDERLELLRQFTDSVKMLMAKATQPQPTESVGAELAQPVAPPQSDLLPFGG